MNFVGKMMITACLMAGVSGQAMAQVTAVPTDNGPYVNADGSRTNDLEAAAATWREQPEFKADHAKAQIGAEYAYARGITGKGVKVGVSDSGVEPSHPEFKEVGKVTFADLSKKLTDGADPRPGEFVLDGTASYRLGGNVNHGTHVAGTVAAPHDGVGMMGVAPGAAIVAAPLHMNNDSLTAERELKAKLLKDPELVATQELIAQGVRVINYSWGSPLTEKDVEGQRKAEEEAKNDPDSLGVEHIGYLLRNVPGDADLDRVMSALKDDPDWMKSLGKATVEADVITVVAAGNDFGAHAAPPAIAPLVDAELESLWISVVNLDVDGLHLENSSSICGQAKAWCIAAPGTEIKSAGITTNLTPEAKLDLSTAKKFRNFYGHLTAIDLSFYAQLFNMIDIHRNIDDESLSPEKAHDAAVKRFVAENPDPEILGKKWANTLFNISRRAMNSSDYSDYKLHNQTDDMHAILDVARNAFNSNLYGLNKNVIIDLSINEFLLVAKEYGWDNSPLYHMEMEIMRLAKAATEAEIGYVRMSGTSMAAPHVSGALALLIERFPYMGGALVRDTLLTTGYELGDDGVDTNIGWGRVDIGKSMKGPGALLRDTTVTLAAGASDMWENDIADGSALLDDKYRGSLTLRGAGTLALVGDNSYVGDTYVRGGKLLVNGTLRASNAFVVDGGTIGGTGDLKALEVGNGGTVAPGNSIGTLKVTGDILFKAGSTYLVESAVNMTSTDRIQVGGKAMLEGGTVQLQADRGDWGLRSRADILTADGGVTGAFTKAQSSLGFLTPLLSYGKNAVALALVRNDDPFASAGRTPNQIAAGTALDGIAPMGALYDALVDGSVAAVSRSLDSFSGEAHASLAAVAWSDTAFVRDAMLRRMPHSSMAIGDGQSENRTASGVVAWGQAIAGFAERDTDAGVATVKTDSKGFVTGIDKSWGHSFNLGVAFGHLNTDANIFRAGSSNSKVRSWHAGGYVSAEFGAARVRAGGSLGWYRNRTARVASVNAFSDSLSASYGGRAWQAFGEFGLGIEAGSLSFEPFANLTHADYESELIAERGGLARLSGRASQKATMTTLGLRSAAKLRGGSEGRSGYARVNVGWRHGFDKDGAIAELTIAESANRFRAIGADIGRDLAVIDLALDLPVTRSLDIGITYGGQFSSVYAAHAAKATLQLRF